MGQWAPRKDGLRRTLTPFLFRRNGGVEELVGARIVFDQAARVVGGLAKVRDVDLELLACALPVDRRARDCRLLDEEGLAHVLTRELHIERPCGVVLIVLAELEEVPDGKESYRREQRKGDYKADS